jgi:DNA-binding NarL/FixJ family response regulator
MNLHAGSDVLDTRLLLVDDHPLVREGLRRILESTGEGWLLDEAHSAAQAQDLLRRHSYRLLVLDLSLPGMSGMELIRRLKPQYPHLPVLVLTMHAESQYAMRAFKAGAKGYVTKDSASDELVLAVRKLLSGGSFVTHSLAEQFLTQLGQPDDAAPHSQLSGREMEVLQKLLAGLRPVEVAASLHMSIKTVSTHKARIMEKLNLPSMAALIRYGLQHQLLDPGPEHSDLTQGFFSHPTRQTSDTRASPKHGATPALEP